MVALLVGRPPVLLKLGRVKPWPGEWLVWLTTMAHRAGLALPLSWTLVREGRRSLGATHLAACALAVPT